MITCFIFCLISFIVFFIMCHNNAEIVILIVVVLFFFFFFTSCIISLLLFICWLVLIGPVSVSPAPPLHWDPSSLTAGGMQSVRSVSPVAAALMALFLSAVMSQDAASVALVLSADAVTRVARGTRGARHGGRCSAFLLKQCSSDGGGFYGRAAAPGGRTDLKQG